MGDPSSVRCPADALASFAAAVLRVLGADAEIADEVSRHLVGPNLAGHDSHGVIGLPSYVAQAERGEPVPAARGSASCRATAAARPSSARTRGR